MPPTDSTIFLAAIAVRENASLEDIRPLIHEPGGWGIMGSGNRPFKYVVISGSVSRRIWKREVVKSELFKAMELAEARRQLERSDEYKLTYLQIKLITTLVRIIESLLLQVYLIRQDLIPVENKQ